MLVGNEEFLGSDVSEDEMKQLEEEFQKEEGTFVKPSPEDNVSKETPAENVQTTEEKTDAQTETVTETSEDNVPPVETPAEEKTTPTVEELLKRIEDNEKKYENYRSLNDRRTAELGQLRQKMADYEGLENALSTDPNFRNMVFSHLSGGTQDNRAVQPNINFDNYDPNDPQSVARIISDTVKNELNVQNQINRETQQRQSLKNMQIDFQNKNRAKFDELVVGGINENDLNQAQRKFFNDFMAGNMPEMAIKYANYDSDIENAKKAGYDEAILKLKNVKNAPKTLASATTSKPSKEAELEVNFDKMTEEQAVDLYNKLPVNHPTALKIEEMLNAGKFG